MNSKYPLVIEIEDSLGPLEQLVDPSSLARIRGNRVAMEVPASHRKWSPSKEKRQGLAFIRLERSRSFISCKEATGEVWMPFFVDVTEPVHGHGEVEEVVVDTGFLPVKNRYQVVSPEDGIVGKEVSVHQATRKAQML